MPSNWFQWCSDGVPRYSKAFLPLQPVPMMFQAVTKCYKASQGIIPKHTKVFQGFLRASQGLFMPFPKPFKVFQGISRPSKLPHGVQSCSILYRHTKCCHWDTGIVGHQDTETLGHRATRSQPPGTPGQTPLLPRSVPDTCVTSQLGRWPGRVLGVVT